MRHRYVWASFVTFGLIAGCSLAPPPVGSGDTSNRPPPSVQPSTEKTTVQRLGGPELSAQAGDHVTLKMRFDAVPMTEDYEVFVHFVAQGQQASAFGGDHDPPAPTSMWSGSVSYDHTVSVPADAAAGTYTIRVGLYQKHAPYDRVALAAGPGVSADDDLRYTVGTLTVTEPSSSGSGGGGGDGGAGGSPPVGGPAGENADDYVLSFDEEFEDGFDTGTWNDHLWWEAPNATKNYTVENGSLKIWPQRDDGGQFFDRNIDTDGKYYQTYGFFEMEAKLPRGTGTWPAFWLFNHIGNRRPEIDIIEAYPGGQGWGTDGPGGVRLPIMYGATIWIDGATQQQGGFQKISTPDLSADFHTYGLKWEANKQTFYFDGTPVYSADVSMPDPMYIILDLAFGSASGQPDDSTPTGIENAYEVRYVRAWQFK